MPVSSAPNMRYRGFPENEISRQIFLDENFQRESSNIKMQSSNSLLTILVVMENRAFESFEKLLGRAFNIFLYLISFKF